MYIISLRGSKSQMAKRRIVCKTKSICIPVIFRSSATIRGRGIERERVARMMGCICHDSRIPKLWLSASVSNIIFHAVSGGPLRAPEGQEDLET